MIKTWVSIPKGKNGQVKYIEKANFSLEILKHINTEPRGGFLCKVYCSLREELKWVLMSI